MTGHDILCFASHDWDYLWQRHQELMWRLAQDGNRVVYVNSLGIRSPRASDWRRVIQRLHKWGRQLVTGVPQPTSNVYVHTPLILPCLNSATATRFNQHWLRLSIQYVLNTLEFYDSDSLIVWVYLPTPAVINVVRQLPRRLLVYDYVDAQTHNPGGTMPGLERSECWLLENADIVVTTSRRLYIRAAAYNSNVCEIPAGVHLERFSYPHTGAVPAELESLPRPRIGYFGQIDARLDSTLLHAIADGLPEATLILIGALRTDIRSLLQKPNAHHLGPVPHQQLGGYLAALDVLILPYVLNNYTTAIYPAKLHECLAVGKPVVSTDLPEVRRFADVVEIASDPAMFLARLRKALATDSPERAQRRRKVAEANAWTSRYVELTQAIENTLNSRITDDMDGRVATSVGA